MSIPFSNTHYRIPRGFANLLEGLTREVLRHQPKDIPQFGAKYFADLLQQRQETDFDPAQWGAALEDRFYNNHSFKHAELNTYSSQYEAENGTRKNFFPPESSADKEQSAYSSFHSDGMEHKEMQPNDTVRIQAATKIQASFRGHMAREELKNRRDPVQENFLKDVSFEDEDTQQDKQQKSDLEPTVFTSHEEGYLIAKSAVMTESEDTEPSSTLFENNIQKGTLEEELVPPASDGLLDKKTTQDEITTHRIDIQNLEMELGFEKVNDISTLENRDSNYGALTLEPPQTNEMPSENFVAIHGEDGQDDTMHAKEEETETIPDSEDGQDDAKHIKQEEAETMQDIDDNQKTNKHSMEEAESIHNIEGGEDETKLIKEEESETTVNLEYGQNETKPIEDEEAEISRDLEDGQNETKHIKEEETEIMGNLEDGQNETKHIKEEAQEAETIQEMDSQDETKNVTEKQETIQDSGNLTEEFSEGGINKNNVENQFDSVHLPSSEAENPEENEACRKQHDETLDIPLDDPDANAAAAKIQAGFRGHMTRKKMKSGEKELKSKDSKDGSSTGGENEGDITLKQSVA